jgi:hypothetical protein
VKALWRGVALSVLAAASAHAASKVVQYGPRPAWANAPPMPTSAPTPPAAPLRVQYFDTQVRLGGGAEGAQAYTAYRLKVLKPEALAIGNVSAMWNPSTDDFTVHSLKIIRDGATIDVLSQQKFRVIERESQLDQATLDGNLTATLQIPGLQVGDELEFAATTRHVDAAFGNRFGGGLQLPVTSGPGDYRVRITWPKGEAVRWKASVDLGVVTPHAEGDQVGLEIELQDPGAVVPTEGAPERYNLRRNLLVTEFSSWGEVSHELAPLFDQAAQLAPNSPIKAEAAKIAATSTDPAVRAEAALRLVQERIRYVFVGLDGGGYRPAKADQTWARKFGDCKAKTVLLLALLRELGIEAEPVLVNSKGGDVVGEMLPSPAAFDHVVVRARIKSRTYWLDGTRIADRRLNAASAPTSRFALAVRTGAADLEKLTPQPPMFPLSSEVLEIDASAGLDKPAKARAEQVMRGDEARQVASQLSLMSKEEAERAIKALWGKGALIDPEAAAWRFDDVTGALIFTVTGVAKPKWEGDSKAGHSLDIYSAGFTPPNELERPKDEDQAAPWITDFPNFKRWTTIIHLPPAVKGRAWDHSALAVDTKLGGVAYWREAELANNVMRTTMSRRTYSPEITADEAREISKRLPTFDNAISQVFEVPADQARVPKQVKVDAARADMDAKLALAEPIDRDDDLAELDEAIREKPEDRYLFLRRAALLRKSGRLDEAHADLDEAWRIDPLDAVVLKARAAFENASVKPGAAVQRSELTN